MAEIGDRVTFMSMLPTLKPGGKPRKTAGVVEYEDGPNNFVVLTDSGVRHSVPKGWLELDNE